MPLRTRLKHSPHINFALPAHLQGDPFMWPGVPEHPVASQAAAPSPKTVVNSDARLSDALAMMLTSLIRCTPPPYYAAARRNTP
eukprot:9017381-Alexandrium_andersonii.AAC.1